MRLGEAVLAEQKQAMEQSLRECVQEYLSTRQPAYNATMKLTGPLDLRAVYA